MTLVTKLTALAVALLFHGYVQTSQGYTQVANPQPFPIFVTILCGTALVLSRGEYESP